MLAVAGEENIDPMQKLDHNMTEQVLRASARLAERERNSLQCFNCGCEGGICFVAMRRKSFQKMTKHGRCIKCPVHQNTTTSSTHARTFYAIVRRLDDNVQGIVWDWFDVPRDNNSNHRMHIDASVFCRDSCTRFEIDGETHFQSNGTSRDRLDEYKDIVLRENKVGMVRLHYMDVDRWNEYVVYAVKRAINTVLYTKSYMDCLHPADHGYVIGL
jgi:hypothetical protein